MKKIALMYIVLFSFFSCAKEKFDISTITETDNGGNYIGNIDEDDWNLYSYNNLTENDKNLILNEFSENYNQHDLTIPYEYLKLDCSNNSFFDLRAYPNPVKRNDTIKFLYNSDFEFLYGLYFTKSKKSNKIIYRAAGGNNGSTFLSDYMCGEVNNEDHTFYYVFVTQDSCVFAGKGDVKIGK